MLLGLKILVACLVFTYVLFLRYIERRQWWTLRLWLSTVIRGKILLSVAITFSIETVIDIRSTQANLAFFVIGFVYLLFQRLLPLADNQNYLDIRWKAWNGPSRTGIPPGMTRYIGSKEDWSSLVSAFQNLEAHPVEKFARLTRPFSSGIASDPTDILKARLKLDEDAETDWLPRSDEKAGVYVTPSAGQSMSLLWGQDLGFIPRCSRGITAVPPPLLNFQPQLKNGIDGKPICLALGILSRNKGLDPHSLVCNLEGPERLRAFEENSTLWPRPSKTLRSFYHAEMSKYFSGLGTSYVRAATELALLLADSRSTTTMDWLDTQMEQQDLGLNNRIAALGADADDISRLYRGQYIAMLVGLSEHRPGITIRPEITVYKAMCTLEGVRESSPWLSDPFIAERELIELDILGERGLRLVYAAV